MRDSREFLCHHGTGVEENPPIIIRVMPRYQPESALTRWYKERFGDGSSRGAPDRDRGAGSQAVGGAVAVSGDRSDPGRGGPEDAVDLRKTFRARSWQESIELVWNAHCKPPGFDQKPTVRWGVHRRASQIALERKLHWVTGQRASTDSLSWPGQGRSYEASCARRLRKLPAEWIARDRGA